MNLLQRALGPVFVLLWSSGYLAGTLATRAAPPFALTVWRFLLAAVLLAGIAVVTRAPWPRGRRAWRDLVVTGVLLQGVQFGAALRGARARGARGPRRARALPVARAGRGALRPGARRAARPRGLVGLGARAAGRARRGRPPPRSAPTAHRRGSACCCSGWPGSRAGTLYQKRTGATMDLRTGTAVQFLAGAAAVLPVALLTEHGLPLPSTATSAAALAWIVVLNSVAGRGPAVRAAPPRHRAPG